MEKIIKKLCTALFALAALFACTREVRPEVPETPRGPETITITINASGEVESRTMIGENGASLWTAGDKLVVREAFNTEDFIHSNSGQSSETNFIQWAETDPAVNGGLEEHFTVHFRAFDNYPDYSALTSMEQIMDYESHPGMKFMYQAFYPAVNAGEGSMSTIEMSLPPLQKPSATSFDPDADLLYSKPVYTATQPTSLTLNFRRLSALGIMTLSGIPDGISENAIVKTVQFISGIDGHQFDQQPVSAPRPKTRSDIDDINLWDCPQLTGSVRTWYNNSINAYREDVFSFNDPEDLEWMSYYWMEEDVDYNTGYIVNLDYTGQNLDPNGLDAYFTCLPATFVDGTCFTVVVSVDDNGQIKTYSRTVVLNGRELEFSSGVATTFSVDMTQAVLMREPTLNDFVTFDEKTLAYFPELGSDNPEIRIPFSNIFNNVAYEGIPISLTPKDGVSFIDCYIDDKYDEWEDLLWLQYYYDRDPEGYYLCYDCDYSDPDNPLSTPMVFELEVNGTIMSFSVPVSDYEYGITFPSASLFLGESEDDYVEVDPYVDSELFVGRSVTLHAVISSKPGDMIPRVCYWTNDEDYGWTLDGDIPVPVHSGDWTFLSLEASSDQRSVVVTGVEEGEGCVNFIMIFDDIWFPDYWAWVYFDVAPLAPPFYGDNDAAGGDMGGGKVINL